MNYEDVPKEIINNEYDFSNIIPTEESVKYLVEYLNGLNDKFSQIIKEDEEKNERLKYEYRVYTYKNHFSKGLSISIFTGSVGNYIDCNDYQSFESAIKDGNLKNVSRLRIDLNLDFARGMNNSLDQHENAFSIVFKPYDITFIRKSNHNDPIMNEIEKQIINILNQFPVANSIFCNKQE